MQICNRATQTFKNLNSKSGTDVQNQQLQRKRGRRRDVIYAVNLMYDNVQ